MHRYLLVAAAVYLGAIGLALLIVPAKFGVDSIPDDPSGGLLWLMRQLSGPFIGVAVLNWMARNAEPTTVRNTVVLANLVGFAVVAGNDIAGLITGDARDLARALVVVHVAFTIAFGFVWTDSGRKKT